MISFLFGCHLVTWLRIFAVDLSDPPFLIDLISSFPFSELASRFWDAPEIRCLSWLLLAWLLLKDRCPLDRWLPGLSSEISLMISNLFWYLLRTPSQKFRWCMMPIVQIRPPFTSALDQHPRTKFLRRFSWWLHRCCGRRRLMLALAQPCLFLSWADLHPCRGSISYTLLRLLSG